MSSNNKQMELWKEYSSTKDPSIREKLILEYSHLVKFIAGRLSIYFGANVEYDDLVGFGIFGLIDAIEKFDVKKGVKFETYASLRIRGSIIDSMRELDWVPRSLRQKSKEMEKVYAELENELGRSATDQEVADRLGITTDELSKRLNDVNVSSMVSLEEFLEQNYEIGVDVPNVNKDDLPEDYIEAAELSEILGNAIDKLPEKEKMVVSLYYFEELTLKEISAIMKVSESRVSQLHTKAILRLKGKLARYKSSLDNN
ncbi:FliA/WhiG family RNA polymerase sigma factor [Pseudoclostridium thermosuccinogenes]|uniref:FliA/WhiG family RNA polymerase sigma factor n=1 Tax=Clostridium thermosuccinogenes TaxID=84032 RepID=UPI000CCC0517|nr:FliA/WhiG family RNA polymerase sigma factor [Pseudoclostridium thermosuccinogenes]PNT92973.1 FliA/WhiG family RNA polymerase sigma factor [Pseudoclostridium thermosuccinogenes]